MQARISGLIVLSILFLPASGARADAASDALRQRVETQRRLDEEEEIQRNEWRQRARHQHAAVEAARRSLAETRANRIRAQDGAHDGVKRSQWTQRVEEAEQALAEAERQQDEFREEARQSEVPPGWLETDD